VAHPSGGARVADRWTRVAWEGVNILLTFRVSEVHEIGARRLEAPTREVASCEKYEKEVKPLLTFASRDFGEEEHESSTLQPGRLRVVKSEKGTSTIAFRDVSESKNSTLW
jgi:hypothetical protein